MGTAATNAKAKYNAKAYDRIALSVKKGKKEEYQKRAEAEGLSLSAWIIKKLDA